MAATAELGLTLDPMGNSLKNLLIWNYSLSWNQTLVKWSLGEPLSVLYWMTPPVNQDGRHSLTYFNIVPYVKCTNFFFIWNYLLNRNQILVKWSLSEPLSELYQMTPLVN